MDYYENNIRVLGVRHQAVVKLLEETPHGIDRVRVIKSKTGLPRLVCPTPDGTEQFIHSAFDPVECAHQAIKLLGEIASEGVIILFGFGLGYFAEELLKKTQRGHILAIYEAAPSLFKTALTARDYSQLFASDRVEIIIGEKPNDISFIHRNYHHILNGRCWLVKHEPCVRLRPAAYGEFEKRLMDEKLLAEMSTTTVVNLGSTFIDTFMDNVPHILSKPGVKDLRGAFRDRPAIIVSAGPSLEKNMHLLRQIKGKATIISVDAALPTLVSADILPDILVAIDPMEENVSFFKDVPALKEIPFICLSQYTPKVLSVYPGPVFINAMPGNVVCDWLSSSWPDKGYITCFGGSVSHLAFATAEYIGAEVVAIIGQDLSYTEKFHAGDVTKSLHDYMDRDVPDYRKGAPVAKDIFGEERYTVGPFLAFRLSFEKRIKEYQGKVVNATEGGLPIEGATPLRLCDFIREYCNTHAENAFPSASKPGMEEEYQALQAVLSQVDAAYIVLNKIKRTCRQILSHIRKVTMLKRQGKQESDEFHASLKSIELLREKVRNPILNIIAHYHYGLELYLKREDVRAVDDIVDKWERFEKQIERGINYYNELLKALSRFLPHLSRLCNTIKREIRIHQILANHGVHEEMRLLQAGVMYKKAGVIWKAVECLERGYGLLCSKSSAKRLTPRSQASLRVKKRDAEILLAELYLEQFRFHDVLPLFSSPDHIQTGGDPVDLQKQQQIDNLVATCNKKIRAWKKRKQQTNNRCKKAEKEYGGELESGYFYYRIGDYERSERAYLASTFESSMKDDAGRLSAAYYGLAHAQIRSGKYEEAVKNLGEVMKLDPKNPASYRDLGAISLENGEYEAAEKILTYGLEVAPQSEDLYRLLANLYVNRGDTKRSLAVYESAVTNNPDNPHLQTALIELYQRFIQEQTGRAG